MPRPAPAPSRRSLTPFYVILGLVLIAGIGLIATQFGKKGSSTGANQAVAVQLTPDQMQRVQGISLGRADAPITIYEFADFQCPHCAQFSAFIEPLIRDNLVNTGKARYVYYDYPVGFKWSWLAARAGRCANEQGKFWDFHGVMFGRQRDWSFERDPVGKFVEYISAIPGADPARFEQCVRSDRFQREVSESGKLGQTLGVQGTPTLFVNGRKLEPLPGSYAEFEARVRQIAPDVFAGAPAAAPAAVPGDSGTVTGQTPAP